MQNCKLFAAFELQMGKFFSMFSHFDFLHIKNRGAISSRGERVFDYQSAEFSIRFHPTIAPERPLMR